MGRSGKAASALPTRASTATASVASTRKAFNVIAAPPGSSAEARIAPTLAAGAAPLSRARARAKIRITAGALARYRAITAHRCATAVEEGVEPHEDTGH